MTQNIYDDDEFFAGYARLPRSVEGLDGAPEWPALRALLPELRGLSVLDLGCGFGWFCRWVRENGAAHVVGIDVSEKMLTRAREAAPDPAITYARADMEQLDLPPAAFDLVYSSLALHYVANLRGLLSQVHRSLVPGGSLVCSIEHPMYTAPTDPGWLVHATGRRVWPINAYLEEGPRSTDWLAKGVIKQHRTVSTYFNLLLHSGFALSHVEEWGPSDDQVAARPQLAEERQRPTFLLLAASRQADGLTRHRPGV
jgi:ubiquinone/menaquinone biosynthesis C-methylase UbiE